MPSQEIVLRSREYRARRKEWPEIQWIQLPHCLVSVTTIDRNQSWWRSSRDNFEVCNNQSTELIRRFQWRWKGLQARCRISQLQTWPAMRSCMPGNRRASRLWRKVSVPNMEWGEEILHIAAIDTRPWMQVPIYLEEDWEFLHSKMQKTGTRSRPSYFSRWKGESEMIFSINSCIQLKSECDKLWEISPMWIPRWKTPDMQWLQRILVPGRGPISKEIVRHPMPEQYWLK